MQLDQIDKKLLMLLQTDSKRTTKAYANELGLSNTAAYERIRRLEKKGVIEKYVTILNKSHIDKAFVVFCHVKLVQHIKDFVRQFEREVLQLEEVIECYHISGDYDYLLKICVKDMEAYRDFMVGKLTALNNIGSTQSSFAIKEVKYSTAIQL